METVNTRYKPKLRKKYQVITAVHYENQGGSLYHAHLVVNTVDIYNGKLYHSGIYELGQLAIFMPFVITVLILIFPLTVPLGEAEDCIRSTVGINSTPSSSSAVISKSLPSGALSSCSFSRFTFGDLSAPHLEQYSAFYMENLSKLFI